MRIAVLAADDPLNIRTWSGTPYFMTMALKERFHTLVVRAPRARWFNLARRTISKVTSGRTDLAWDPRMAERDANRIARRLKTEQIHVAIAVACSPISAYLAKQIPTIHISDATVPLMRDYYSEFSVLPEFIAKRAYEMDRASVLNSRVCLYPTQWAANSALKDYDANPTRVFANSWGANIEHRTNATEPESNTCNLVFIGVDWKRKGGQIAVDTVNELAAAGFPIHLHIIGASPSMAASNVITIHGFINKRTAEGRRKFDELMQQSAFLFVPTRQDCYGLIFPEANSYGVPVITTITGGVPDVVQEGVNGHLLPIDAPASAYAELIRSIWSDRPRYDQLRQTSKIRFDESLNWGSWLDAVTPIIQGVYLEEYE